MPLPFPRSTVRRLLLAGAGIGAIACAVVVSASLAAASRTVVISDPAGDVGRPLDLTRVSLQRASDGRLRGVMSFAEEITPKALLATSGPPGSACLRIWTGRDADPSATRPDRLVCVTARDDDELRGGIYEVRGSALPERLAGASVKLNASGRSVVIRFAQRPLGRPQRIRFAAESTRPGCERPGCIDTAPDKRATRSFRLR